MLIPHPRPPPPPPPGGGGGGGGFGAAVVTSIYPRGSIMRTPFCIGLTGGIGSGKSSAAKIFQELGAAVVDTDQIAHELTRRGGAAIAAIADHFGADCIAADGSLDRSKMRRQVFADPKAKRKLKAILHPLIRRESR